jgi:hypothetical protein
VRRRGRACACSHHVCQRLRSASCTRSARVAAACRCEVFDRCQHIRTPVSRHSTLSLTRCTCATTAIEFVLHVRRHFRRVSRRLCRDLLWDFEYISKAFDIEWECARNAKSFMIVISSPARDFCVCAYPHPPHSSAALPLNIDNHRLLNSTSHSSRFQQYSRTYNCTDALTTHHPRCSYYYHAYCKANISLIAGYQIHLKPKSKC